MVDTVLSKCSVGVIVNEDYNKSSYGLVSKVKKTFSEFTDKEKSVLKLSSHDFQVLNATTLSTDISFDLKKKDYIACMYNSCWWLAEVNAVQESEKECCVHFLNIAGSSTSFQRWYEMTSKCFFI
ncbi:hypothetical protein PR048_031908 [Dryococelus australis]|uniref:Uncharacterized protein n=1 Tax=Dryococelus australis TaxID=614101 RepID=A0ABQ9G6K9_9NEOP|nr:hypothetical protein PR048_031908 [Dryococelus australis]